MRIAVEFDWEELGDVTLSTIGRLAIPRVPVEPGVYRFLVPAESQSEVYIGQASDLRRRMRNYAGTHSGSTNTRIRQVLSDHLAVGKRVQYSIVRRARVAIDGEPVDGSLLLGHVRLLIESAALAYARQAGQQIHNL